MANFVIKFSACAFLLLAFSTKSRIFEAVDSSNSFVTLIVNIPVLLMQPLRTASPFTDFLGTDSPVRALVSNIDSPSSTIPSNGIFSPGFTTILSPIDISSGSTFTNFPSCSMFA